MYLPASFILFLLASIIQMNVESCIQDNKLLQRIKF